MAFAAELATAIASVRAEVKRRSAAAQDQLDAHDAAGAAPARVDALVQGARALLGEDFRIVPEFTVAAAQGDDWEAALAASTGGELFQYLTTRPRSTFPIDEWLYGVARVREPLRHLGAGHPARRRARRGRGRAHADPASRTGPASAGWGSSSRPTRASTATACSTPRPTRRPSPRRRSSAACCSTSGPRSSPATARRPASPSTTTARTPRRRRRCSWSPPPRGTARGSGTTSSAPLHETLDLAAKRAVEPAQIDATPYARFLPATITAATLYGISIATAFAANNLVVTRPCAMPDRFEVLRRVGRARGAAVPDGHHLEPARGPAADPELRPRAEGRGARRPVDAHAPVAGRRVPRRRRRLAVPGQAPARAHAAHQVPPARPRRRAVRRPPAARGERRAAAGALEACAATDLARPTAADGAPVAEADRRHRRLPPGVHRRLPDHGARPDAARRRRSHCASRGVAGLRRGRRPTHGRRRALRAPQGRPRQPRLRRGRRDRPRRRAASSSAAARASSRGSSASSFQPGAEGDGRLGRQPARVPVRLLGARAARARRSTSPTSTTAACSTGTAFDVDRSEPGLGDTGAAAPAPPGPSRPAR